MAQPECASTSTKYSYNMVNEIDRALKTMRTAGISEVSDAYKELYSLRGKILAQIGFKFPRPVSLVAKLAGLSPGEVRVWHDAESGWLAEARAKPGAPPVYHAVDDEVAMAILKGELTKEQEEKLMTPDEYLGE